MFAAMAASPTGHLHQGGEETLGGAEVGREQAGVGIHHHHQRQAVEIVPLGQHLRAHQQIGAPGMHVVQKGLGRAFASCHVTVQAADVRAGEKRCQRVFQFLRAAPERGQVLVATGRARTGYGLRGGAVMADQAIARGALIAALSRFIQRKEAQGRLVPGARRVARGSGWGARGGSGRGRFCLALSGTGRDAVQHAIGVAPVAARQPAAGITPEYRGEAPPIQEKQCLLAAGQGLADGLQAFLGQAFLGLGTAQGHGLHLGQGRLAAGPMAQAQQLIAAQLCVMPALQRGGGRAQKHRDPGQPAPGDGHVACRVAQTLLLLVGRVVFLVDDDGAQARERGQNGQARAQDDACPAAGGRQPVTGPCGVGHLAVQDGNGLAGKAALQLHLQGGRQSDFRHHQEHLNIRL